MPFDNIEVFRGQSRGLEGGMFSIFKSKKTDDSGMETNMKVVGTFKGRLTVNNELEKLQFEGLKYSRQKIIKELVENIHQKKFGKPYDFCTKKLLSFEGRQKVIAQFEEMGLCPHETIQFMKHQSYEQQINKMLVQRTKCLVRVYIYDGFDFAQRDIGSFSDPYLKI